MIDVSVALAWLFPGEDNPYAAGVLKSLSHAEGCVPSLWALETANALVVAERKRRITPAECGKFLDFLRRLDLAVDSQTSSQAFADTLYLARRHSLSVYDASYLELALRRAIPLATLDKALIAAARKAGVPLAPIRAS